MKISDYKMVGEHLPIYTYPDPVLTQIAREVQVFDKKLEKLVQDMLFTMYHAPGCGLAAPQIGQSIRLFVVDIDYEREEVTDSNGKTKMEFLNLNPMVFINPKFSHLDGKIIGKEACLSVPDVYEEVTRSEKLIIDYQDLKGNPCQMEANDFMAVCLQHENDHLDGIVFIDRLSPLKKKFFKTKLLKDKKRI